jgi:hypothetical protein
MEKFISEINKLYPVSDTSFGIKEFGSLQDFYNNLQTVKAPVKYRKLWKLYLSFAHFLLFEDPKIEHMIDFLYLYYKVNPELTKTYFRDYIENYQRKKSKDVIYLDKKFYKFQLDNIKSIFDKHNYKIEKIAYFKPQGIEYIIDYYGSQGLHLKKQDYMKYFHIAENYITDMRAVYDSSDLRKLSKIQMGEYKTIKHFMKQYITKIEKFLQEKKIIPSGYKSQYTLRSISKPIGLFSVEMSDNKIYFNYFEGYDKQDNNLEEIINTMVHEFIHYYQYLTAKEIDSILTPGYIFEGYAHYAESLFIHAEFLKNEKVYPIYIRGYYKDSLMRLYRYYYCMLYNMGKISSDKIYSELLKFYESKLIAENETIRILMDPYVCGYYLVKEMYLEKYGFDMKVNKKLMGSVEKQRKALLGF